MKYFFALLLTVVFACGANAQWLAGNTPCGSTPDDSAHNAEIALNVMSYRDMVSKTNTVRYVPIVFHLVADAAGNGYFTDKQTWDLLCLLNNQYTPVNIQFYLLPWYKTFPNRQGNFDMIASNTYNNLANKSVGWQLMGQRNVEGAVNAYIMESPGPNLCGFATFPNSGAPLGGGACLAKSCNGLASTTIAHELGHYFSLFHPFETSNGVEYVNGTNCSFAGDKLCDTRADFLSTRWNCPYTGNQTDPNGDPYNPDETLYMSYSDDPCQTRFSPQQLNVMNNTLTNQRSNLLTTFTMPAPVADTVARLDPPSGSTWAVYNQANFAWRSVANANAYRLRITLTNGGLPVFETVTPDTTYTVLNRLYRGTNYRWTVTPLGEANPCGVPSSYTYFKTSNWTLGTEQIATHFDGLAITPSLTLPGQAVELRTATTQTDDLNVRIFDLSGRLINATNLRVGPGSSSYTLSNGTLPSGAYLVRYDGNTLHGSLRFVVAQ